MAGTPVVMMRKTRVVLSGLTPATPTPSTIPTGTWGSPTMWAVHRTAYSWNILEMILNGEM